MQLLIGNKNYSSWSMRPAVLVRHFNLPVTEVMLRFDSFAPGSVFKTRLAALPAAGKVPVLIDGDQVVWDSLAIAETLAERFPDAGLWPRDAAARARARSLCAEMHSGFGALRSACPMNIEAGLPEVGARVLAEQPAVVADLARLHLLWESALAAHGGPFLFGAFSIADAYFAPVLMRCRTYALPLSAPVAAWAQAVEASPGVAAWVRDALAEHDFLAFEEPYRQAR